MHYVTQHEPDACQVVNVIMDGLMTFEHVFAQISTGQFSAIVVVVYCVLTRVICRSVGLLRGTIY